MLVTRVKCAKTADPIEMPFEVLTLSGPKKYVLDKKPDPFEIVA